MDMPSWLEEMSIKQRTELALRIISNLPTPTVCEIVQRLRPRMYIDFMEYLPEEICLDILGFLDPISLIRTAQASRKWMQLALDRQLWEQLYRLEGFKVMPSEVIKFEALLNNERSRSNDFSNQIQPSKRRATLQRLLGTPIASTGSGNLEMVDVPATQWPISGSRHTLSNAAADEIMMDAPTPSSTVQSSLPMHYQPQQQVRNPTDDKSRTRTAAVQSAAVQSAAVQSAATRSIVQPTNIFSLTTNDARGRRRLNWQHLYSQRQRLEANWEAERFTNFQLPHPDHPEEAHSECIYTIQFSGKYLVSGSRDRTLRIWDIDTKRLVSLPLRGHSGSVLCLQFDADPEEDLIVSGSSDSTVILWKFSTGQMIQRLRKAHKESVLNVRFDKRVLVTCSKDKTIKIFNRRPMNPGDFGISEQPGWVQPVPTVLDDYGFNTAPSAGPFTRPAFSLIGCLEGHHAAVNAVQIHGSEVVSASGDRTVKIWDWTRSALIRTLIGHSKGIACVQYDGRRIVSGSSDDEVKVFDRVTGLEVASLRAHTNLVRTVQAGFGDLPFSEEDDKATARKIDLEYFEALDSGILNKPAVSQRPRNAGSRKPEDITAYGAKIPPGGGGGKFGRIVSGSYDETIIIWRRDREGVWRPLHTLRHEEAARVASSTSSAPARASRRRLPLPSTPSATIPNPPAAPVQPLSSSANMVVNAPISPFVPGSEQWHWHKINLAVSHGPSALRESLQNDPTLLGFQTSLRQAIATLPLAARQAMCNEIINAIDTQLAAGNPAFGALKDFWTGQFQQTNTGAQATFSASVPATNVTQASAPPPSAQAQAATAPNAQTSTLALVVNPAVVVPAPVQAPPAAVAAAPTQNHAHNHGAAQAHQHNHLPDRVFKLQFDARRIICCSQTSVIVGWDFANDDEQIIEASRFFAPIE
ncbi:WD40-repeat-containing domain protein [Calycina marina]|uniref:WD40-repeat-containing domain protein n=1 Tax=Calycina marina TaxID=1763456 RepID=A0A9P7ZCH2_9HELO|nr:WD40-repeat-containing domain protein [Calycina marina]